MKEISKIASTVQASTTLAIDAMFKQMKADGIDVIGFGAGEPDFNTPAPIKAAGIEAIETNFTHYTPAAGILPLREAVCMRMKTDYGLDYTPSQVVVATGAKYNLYLALSAVLNPGDEVIVPAPYWISYYEMVRMLGCVPVIVDAPEEEAFKLHPEQVAQAVTDRTKAIILNNPSNPTGMVYTREELQAVADICVKNDLYIIADEIYSKLIYDGATFTSIASLSEEVKARTILVNGVSKAYAMTGWRIGYSCAPDNIAKVMANLSSHSTSAPSSMSQKAALAALTCDQTCVEEMRREFEARRNYMVERMNQIDGVSCLKPQGAFYVMMNLKELLGRTIHGTVISDADTFADVFLREGLVCVVPCTGFGAPSHVRWSYATSLENIKEGLDRLEKFLKQA
ncbi:MAG: pyridoxal phosphate-dependent aminotransferase [Oscillospiraceae bacterium]|nr:pyridoxal phosphate-dependent aminotransferase [Oscillospiraceae bacterium]